MPLPQVSRKTASHGFSALWICVVFLILPIGCRGKDHIQRKTVQDLYGEAIHAANSRPAPIQPCYPTVHREYEHTVPMEEVEMLPSHIDLPTRPPSLSRATIQEREDNKDGSTSVASTRRSTNSKSQSEHLPKIVSASYVTRNENAGISEIFEQTDIREAIQILATAANVSVVIDDTIGGATSAQIENESFEGALEKILMPLGLVYVKLEGKYLIVPPDPDSPLYSFVSERNQFAPQYHDVIRLTGLLPPRYKKFLHSSAERNLILIDAPREIGADIRKRLEELDQPVPQVELEAIVCVVSPDSGFRFGLDWGHVVGVEGVDSLKAGMTGLTFAGSASPNGFNNAFSDFAVTSAFVRLLAQEGYITIRAAPRVTAKDGEKASIAINREAFFSLQPSGSNVLFRQDVQKVESGISLEIIPRVHGDMVSVNIGKAEVSEDIRASDSRAETSNPFPVINRRVVSTNVNVQNGHTIVIGGLVQSQTVDRVNHIPGLSRLPLVGGMFKTIEKQKQDAEVAIFISPRIVPTQSCEIRK